MLRGWFLSRGWFLYSLGVAVQRLVPQRLVPHWSEIGFLVRVGSFTGGWLPYSLRVRLVSQWRLVPSLEVGSSTQRLVSLLGVGSSKHCTVTK